MARTDGTDTLSQDRVFDILSNPRRRFVLHYLSRNSDSVPLRELADEVARWETGDENLNPQQRKRVYVSLYQTHIPRLADAGMIEFDSDSGLVNLADRAHEIDNYVKTQSNDRRWPIYYIVVGLLGISVYLVRFTGVLPFVSDFVATVLVIGLLFGVSAFHIYHSWRRTGFEMDPSQLTRRENR
jgi:DNA-binding transcriptional ArsR family regulator